VQLQTFNNLKYVDCMAWKASKWGLNWLFADNGHDLAARGMPLYVSRKGAGKAFGGVVGGLLPPVCSLLPP